MFRFSEPSQDGYHDPAVESVHTVPSAYSSSGFEANEYGPDAWEDSSANPSLLDVVCDDSNIVAGTCNAVREIVFMCFIHNLSTNFVRGRATGFFRRAKFVELN